MDRGEDMRDGERDREGEGQARLFAMRPVTRPDVWGSAPSINASTVVRPSWRRDSLTIEQFLAPARKIGRGAHGRGWGGLSQGWAQR